MTARKDLKKHIRARQEKTGESYTAARAHFLRCRDAEIAVPAPRTDRITAIVLKTTMQSIRVRIPGEDVSITLRTSGWDAMRVVPGQFVEVTLTKRWTWREDAYASGTLERIWTDVPALGLEPLPLADLGVTDLSRYEPFTPPEPYAEMWEFFASTPRRAFEFHEIAWGAGVGTDPGDPDDCLIAHAAEISEENPDEAREVLMKALLADLRCIDAHVHLGNLVFTHDPKHAIRHYEIAVGIGELSLGPNFEGMLLWGHLYNRPFLRALHSYGLCLWRLGQVDKARRVFERLLALNPPDNQGVRSCWDDIRTGLPWDPDRDPDHTLTTGESPQLQA